MKKVLIVEKDVVTARRSRTFWNGAGYEARLLTDVQCAAFEAAQWMPDLITVNMEGSQMEGAELLRQLQARPQTSRIPVVLVSSQEPERLPDALLRSVRVILEKPLRFDRMLEGLRGEAAPIPLQA